MSKTQKKDEKEKINFKHNLSIYWGFLSKYKLLLFTLLFILFLAESRGVIDRYLLKIIVDSGTEFSNNVLPKTEFVEILFILGIIFGIVSLMGVLANWFEVHLINRIESKMIFDLKEKFFNHILSLDHNFHITHKTGSLISRITRGGNAMERITDVIIFNFAAAIFQLAIVTFSLIYLDFVSAIVIVFTVILFASYSLYLQKLQQTANLELNKQEDKEKGNISDFFTNIDSIKYFGKESFIRNRYKKISNKTKKAQENHWDYFRWMSSGQRFILILGTFFIVFFSLIRFLNGSITLGTLTFSYTVYLGLIGHMFSLVNGVRGFYRSMADFQDLFEYGKIEKEIKDKQGAKNLDVSKGEVLFDNVSFHYGKKRAFSLDDFTLKIKPNEKVALVGHSGCGKTTLIKLLYRLFDVNSGRILIDGQDIRNVKQESLRSELSIVPQEAILFDDTIFNNIRFSNPKASKEEVRNAIKFAQLDKFVENLSRKENTIVGERGVKLSGGEKQRVSIARAILANKKILVLDEATSALDSETEHEIQKQLQKLLKGRTSIIVAHRLSTIMNADRIIVMRNGKIIQEGSHNELINQSGEYRKLWNLQKGGYIK